MTEPRARRVMGRPRVANARGSVAQVYLTAYEMDAVTDKAAQTNQSVSNWLRSLVLKEIGETK